MNVVYIGKSLCVSNLNEDMVSKHFFGEGAGGEDFSLIRTRQCKRRLNKYNAPFQTLHCEKNVC